MGMGIRDFFLNVVMVLQTFHLCPFHRGPALCPAFFAQHIINYRKRLGRYMYIYICVCMRVCIRCVGTKLCSCFSFHDALLCILE
jgi:hypothetical protein